MGLLRLGGCVARVSDRSGEFSSVLARRQETGETYWTYLDVARTSRFTRGSTHVITLKNLVRQDVNTVFPASCYYFTAAVTR